MDRNTQTDIEANAAPPQLDSKVDSTTQTEQALSKARAGDVSPASDTDSAVDRVFATPELLEMILLQVGKPSSSKENLLEPVVQLFALQRVSRTFRDAIRGSVPAQNSMTMPPEDTELEDQYDIEALLDLAGPNIYRAYRSANRGESWRRIHVLHENADPICLYERGFETEETVERDIDTTTTYGDLLVIEAEMSNEMADLDAKAEAEAYEDYAAEIWATAF